MIFLISILFSINSFSQPFALPAKPHSFKLSDSELNQMKANCQKDQKGISCYNYAVYLTQNLLKEDEGLVYYRKSCDKKYVYGCFNLGAVLIKNKKTRDEGLKYLKSTCVDKDRPPNACKLFKVTNENKTLEWIDIFNKYVLN